MKEETKQKRRGQVAISAGRRWWGPWGLPRSYSPVVAQAAPSHVDVIVGINRMACNLVKSVARWREAGGIPTLCMLLHCDLL